MPVTRQSPISHLLSVSRPCHSCPPYRLLTVALSLAGPVRRFSQVACICIVQAGSDHAVLLIRSFSTLTSFSPTLHPLHSVELLSSPKCPTFNSKAWGHSSCRRIYREVRVHALSIAISETYSPQGWQQIIIPRLCFRLCKGITDGSNSGHPSAKIRGLSLQ